jgi:methyl-accepting chemotaxis protein
MREKLELKILSLVVLLLLIGILAAGLMVLTIEKESLYSITKAGSEATADIVARNVERTMLEGRADVTKELMNDLKGASGIEEISVFNFEGREAFNRKAAPTEAAMLKKIVEAKVPLHITEKKKIIFYKPLENKARCRKCHADRPGIIGAVKITVPIEREYNKAVNLIMIVIALTAFACVCFSIILWSMIRRMVISPIKSLEKAAQEMAKGDLTFDIEIKSRDEIGRFSSAIKDSMLSISGVLKRIGEVTKRINYVSEEVALESKKVVDGAILENEAISNISSSIEEMNAAISEIAEGTEGLAASAEETAASMEQMVTSIAQINGSTQDLSVAVESTSASIEQLSATIREVANNSEELAGAAEETQSAIVEIASSVREVEQGQESAMLSDKVRTDASTFGMTA